MKILNKENWLKEQQGKIVSGKISDITSKQVIHKSLATARVEGTWKNSSNREKFLEALDCKRKKVANSRQANAATGYDPSEMTDLLADVMLDIARTAVEMPNYVSTFYNVNTMNGIQASEVKLRDLLRPIVKGQNFNGSGDLPPIMEHRLGLVEEVPLKFFGFGDKSAIRDIILSPNIDRITEAAALAIVNSDNDLVFNPMVSATYDTNHSVAFDSTTGASNDVKIYNTVKRAIKKAIQLKNPLTSRILANGNYEVVLFLNKYDALDVIPVVQGQVIDNNGSTTKYNALPIDTIVQYNGAEDNGAVYMGETLNFVGVPIGSFFILIKTADGAQKINVVDWTIDVDGGNARIKGEERYWWNYGGVYNANVLPTTQAGVPCGSIVKGALA